MHLIYPNNIYYQIKDTKIKKKNNSKNGYRKKQKMRSKERNRLRLEKQQDRSLYYYEDDITIHSKTYEYNNESKIMVFTNPDLMNIILGNLGYYSFISLSLVSRTFNELFKGNMDIFMAKSNTDYYKNYRITLYKDPKNINKWSTQNKLIENIIYRVDDYRSLIYKCNWFYNREFLIIYNNVCFEYNNMSDYEKFVKTYLLYKKYIKNMYKCKCCRWSHKWCNDINNIPHTPPPEDYTISCWVCNDINTILREIYFYKFPTHTLVEFKELMNSKNYKLSKMVGFGSNKTLNF